MTRKEEKRRSCHYTQTDYSSILLKAVLTTFVQGDISPIFPTPPPELRGTFVIYSYTPHPPLPYEERVYRHLDPAGLLGHYSSAIPRGMHVKINACLFSCCSAFFSSFSAKPSEGERGSFSPLSLRFALSCTLTFFYSCQVKL